MKGLNAIKSDVYRPNYCSFDSCTDGHCTTILGALRNRFILSYYDYKYYFEEDFYLSDGGKICLSFKGNFEKNSTGPVVFFAPGCGGHAKCAEVRTSVDRLV